MGGSNVAIRSSADQVKNRLRQVRRNGGTLEDALAKLPPHTHDMVRALWAEIEAEKPPRKVASYREGIEFIAMNDEPTNLCDDPDAPDYVGAMPTCHLLAVLFGKDVHDVARDVVRFRKRQLG